MITRVGDVYDGVFGREAELAAVEALLAAAPKGFALLSIEGDPGIGKTTVWREALRRARAAGFRVLSTRPTQSEASLSLAGLTDLFGHADDALTARLAAPQQEAFRAALLQTSAPSRGIDERALCAAVLSTLRLLAETSPLLVAVDDAQWLDTPSARALAFAVRRLDTEQVAVLATVRTTPTRAPTFDHVAEPARRRVLRLGPLSVAALHEAIKLRTGRSLPRPVIVQLANASGGNPFHAIEIAAELGDQPLDTGRLPVPASLTDLIASRLRRLPGPTRDAVLAAALLSRPTTEVVDGGALEPAQRAGIVLIDGAHIRFTHPLFASAIERHAGGAERRRVHHALAELLADPEERARHAALGAERPDELIAGTLESAATMARSRGAPAASAELLELSIALTPPRDDSGRATRRVAAAASWFDAGDLTRAQTMLEEACATEALAPPRRAQALGLLGQLHSRRSSFAQALAVGQQGLEAAAGDPALRAELEMDVAFYSASVGDVPSAVVHAHLAVEAAEQAGVPALLADTL
ncbi:MAG TPA: AAA family ATPase, partial [Candidatus Dormibacteraeota bacterium]|nr:AAA family ATPase [Candidatus Dormibacteraeota bacterium]